MLRQRSDSDASGLNTSKVSFNSMGTSFSDRMLRMKPIEKKNKTSKFESGSKNSNDSESSLLSGESDEASRPLSHFDLVSLN